MAHDEGERLGHPAHHHHVLGGGGGGAHPPQVGGELGAQLRHPARVAVVEPVVRHRGEHVPYRGEPPLPGEHRQIRRGRPVAVVRPPPVRGRERPPARAGPPGPDAVRAVPRRAVAVTGVAVRALVTGHGERRHPGARAHPGDEEALGDELLVRLDHHAPGQAEVAGELAGGGEPLAGAEAAGADRVAQPAGDLGGDAALGAVDGQVQIGQLVLGSGS